MWHTGGEEGLASHTTPVDLPLLQSSLPVCASCLECELLPVQCLFLCTHRCHTHQSQSGPGPSLTREDVVLLTEELDQAKTALAEVQALRLEMKELSRRDQEQGEGGGGRVMESGRVWEDCGE